MGDAYEELKRIRAEQDRADRATAAAADSATRNEAVEQAARNQRAQQRDLQLIDFLRREQIPMRPTYRKRKQSPLKYSWSNKRSWHVVTYSSPSDDVWVLAKHEAYEELTTWTLLSANGEKFEGTPTWSPDSSDIAGTRIKGLTRGPGWHISRPYRQTTFTDDSGLLSVDGFARYCLAIINMNLKSDELWS
ncbi:hypothetical protein [Nocardia sp. NPDC052112]|uniref:hypothetical protein n=1 Tax=Nocardia sp. NPDC052112 TaxID=3155646 RepID=UPI00341FBA59